MKTSDERFGEELSNPATRPLAACGSLDEAAFRSALLTCLICTVNFTPRDSSTDWLINKFGLTVWSALIIHQRDEPGTFSQKVEIIQRDAPKFDTSNISSLLRVPGTRGFTQTHRCQISGCQVWSLSTCWRLRRYGEGRADDPNATKRIREGAWLRLGSAAAAPQKPQTLTFLCVCVQIKHRTSNMSVTDVGRRPRPASTLDATRPKPQRLQIQTSPHPLSNLYN